MLYKDEMGTSMYISQFVCLACQCLFCMCIIFTADHLNSVDMLGSEDGQALVLFNSCLVCRFSLDADFGSVALVGCFVLQLSLHRYNDDQLPSTLTPLSWCTFATPLLFSMTTDGIVCILFL